MDATTKDQVDISGISSDVKQNKLLTIFQNNVIFLSNIVLIDIRMLMKTFFNSTIKH